MKLAPWICLALAFLDACRTPSQPSARDDANGARPVPSAQPSRLISSEVTSNGLRIESGIWPQTNPSGVWGFTDVEVDLERARLSIALAKDGAQLADLLVPGALAVVNGGYFEADFRPSTWLKQAGVELAPKSDTSKGGLLAIGSGAPYVGAFPQLSFEPELAVQSFPLLVEPDFVLGIHRDDGRRAARTVVCLARGRLHFIVVSAPRGEGPTLFETASVLREAAPRGFGCGVALNLDGGPSSGVWFAPQISARQRAPLAKVAYAIAISPR